MGAEIKYIHKYTIDYGLLGGRWI